MEHGHESHPARVLSLILMILALLFSSLVTMPVYADDVTYHETKEEAAAELREAMKRREETVTIGLMGEADQKVLKKTIGELIDLALAHTGEADEGDYLKFQYDSYKGYAQTKYQDGSPAMEVEYTLAYSDNAEQEKEVDIKVEEIMSSLDLEEKTEFEKIRAIHNYICKNVKYEKEENSGNLCRTAYGALIEGRAVCQGYSVALYRLLLEAGIDNRIVFGKGIADGKEEAHAWNIVKLEGDYYYVDVTWDDSTWSREYFLRPAGSDFETSHIADDDYPDDFFTEQYPVTTEEYTGETRSFFAMVSRMLRNFTEAIREGAGKLLANS